MSVSTTSPNNSKIISVSPSKTSVCRSYSINGDASAGNVQFTIYFENPTMSWHYFGKYSYTIDYLNFYTDDIANVNSIGNRVDYPQLIIQGGYWSLHPSSDQDNINFLVEESGSNLSIPNQFRIQNINLGHYRADGLTNQPSVSVYYNTNTNGKSYNITIQFSKDTGKPF